MSADEATSGNPDATSVFTFTVKPWAEQDREKHAREGSSRHMARSSPKPQPHDDDKASSSADATA
jgi:hypothetical protein